MRILFLDQFTEMGGAQIGLRDIMSEVQSRGWDAWLMAPGTGPLAGFCTSSGIPFQSLQSGPYANGRKTPRDIFRFGFDSARAARQVRDIVRRNRIDLIYVNGPRALPAAAASDCRMLFHAHSFLDKRYSRMIARCCIGYRGTNVVAVSAFAARAFTKQTPVIYNGVDDYGFRERPRSGKQKVVGIVGRIAPEKGHLDFIRAARIFGERSETKFVAFGAALFSDPGYERSVRAEAAQASVELRGWTDDVSSALHEIDVLAVPSAEIEACPRVVLEALSAGTPIVAYPSGGIPEIVTHGETGFLTSATGPDALAAGIRTLLESPELMSRCSRQGREEWQRRFSATRFRREVGDLIARCCA